MNQLYEDFGQYTATLLEIAADRELKANPMLSFDEAVDLATLKAIGVVQDIGGTLKEDSK